MMKIEIKNVDKIIQDFTNRKISIYDKTKHLLWENTYSNEHNFNRMFNKINKIFLQELQRRTTLAQTT